MENVIQVRNEYHREQWTQIIQNCQNSELSNKNTATRMAYPKRRTITG